jgi:hypothetical protein
MKLPSMLDRTHWAAVHTVPALTGHNGVSTGLTDVSQTPPVGYSPCVNFLRAPAGTQQAFHATANDSSAFPLVERDRFLSTF